MKVVFIVVALAVAISGYGCSDNPAENPQPKPSQQADGSLKR